MRIFGPLILVPVFLIGLALAAGLIVKDAGAAVLTLLLGGGLLLALRTRRARPVPESPVRLAEAEMGDAPRAAPGVISDGSKILGPYLGTLPKAGLPVVLGQVGDHPTWLDLAKAPHLLVGGATGSGKSTFLHTLIVSAAALQTPQRLRMVLVDPKRVELNRYRRLPHVAAYACEPDASRAALARVEAEMDRRYRGMDALGVRDVTGTREPRVLVVIDEYADLVLLTRRTPQDVEPLLYRLLALGRAAGIHVVLATQRPDAKVVTGLIKANAPTRIAFRTSNAVESRIVLDVRGAEALPGAGAGLIVSAQVPNESAPGQPVRFQGVRFEDGAIDRFVAHFSLDIPVSVP